MDNAFLNKEIKEHPWGLLGVLEDHFKDKKPYILTEAEALEEIKELYWKIFPNHHYGKEISYKEWKYFKKELTKRFKKRANYCSGKLNFYTFLYIDSGQKTERTPNLEWYDWDFTFYYIPEEDDNDVLKDIPDELALRYAKIRHDRIFFSQFSI